MRWLLALALAGCRTQLPDAPADGATDMAQLAATGWPMEGHDAQRRGRSDGPGPHDGGSRTGPLASGAPVVGDDGTVYAAANGAAALDPATGAVRWSGPPCGAPSLGGGLIVCGTLFTNVPRFGAIDPATRNYRWTQTGFEANDSPAIVGDTAYLVGLGGVRAVGLADGATRWMAKVGAASQPAAVDPNGTVYVAAEAGLLALSAGDGALSWMAADAARPAGPPVVGLDGNIYVPRATDGELVAIGPGGNLAWRRQFLAPRRVAVASDGSLRVVAADRLYALDPDGNERWSVPPLANDAFTGAIALSADDTAYAGARSAIYALDAGGANVGMYAVPAPPAAMALGPDGRLFTVADRVYGIGP